jgi:endonuclease-3
MPKSKKTTARPTGARAAKSKSASPKSPAHLKGIREALAREFPDATCALHWKTPLQLLVATILSAQCTDTRVNMVTPALFKRYRTAKDFADADSEELKGLVRSTGFFNQKAKSIQEACAQIADEHGGKVPQTMDELLQLRGVARKTANVLLGTAFGKNEGVVVDTHVKRLAKRFGITSETDPTKIERTLMEVVPREEWTDFAHRVVLHGRKHCTARKPNCEECPCLPHCPQVGV